MKPPALITVVARPSRGVGETLTIVSVSNSRAMSGYRIPRLQLVRFADDEYTKVAAKLWGDGIKRVFDDQTKPLLNVTAPPPKYTMPTDVMTASRKYTVPSAVTAAAGSGNYVALEYSLPTELRE